MLRGEHGMIEAPAGEPEARRDVSQLEIRPLGGDVLGIAQLRPPCASCRALPTPHLDRHVGTGTREHLDQRVDAEALDLAAHEIGDPRMS